MRTTLLFNDDWLYTPQPAGDELADSDFSSITLPHTNIVLPHKNFHDSEYQFISTYRKRFRLPQALAGRRLFIDFEGAMLAASVSINGHTFPEHKGGYTPFSFDVTDYIHEDGENLLVVELDSTERHDIPPFGYVVDYLTFGGIYRDAHLRYVEPTHIVNVRVRTLDTLSSSPHIEVDIILHNSGPAQEREILIRLMDAQGQRLVQATQLVNLPAAAETRLTMGLQSIGPVSLWQLDDPVLYTVETELRAADALIDTYPARFGFREARFEEDGFYFNGKLLQLRGLNRHQIYPYIGAAASAGLQRRDADIVKTELACNIVRTSHYPQSRYFLDRCDEIGLLVFEEIPGWQHIGDEAWKQLSLRDVRVMIERDWNRPSIVIWGVRINESLDDHDFYSRTNALARELDPTRQTGGVRYWPHSEFLEDVYTYNDFSNDVIEPTNSPWLITEFNGHMFPTKTFDNEERQVEHALRHARIQARAASMGGVSGAIGWCAFDYNTHKEFGSGDRVCYHGVMDMFRQPKYAAYFYGSQIDPTQRIVLQAATIWSMGDRSVGGNDPLYIFSNCDSVEVYAGEERIGRFEPSWSEFPGLPHPPFKITGLGMRWGEQFGDLHVLGYLGDEVVKEQWVACDGQPHALLLEADRTTLQADGMDMVQVNVRIVERYGNRLPYVNRVLQFELEGPADFYGENPFPLMGGQTAVYLRARKEAGSITLKVHAARLPSASITLTLE